MGLSSGTVGIIVGVSVGTIFLVVFSTLLFIRVSRRRRRAIIKKIGSPSIQTEEQLHSYFDTALLDLRPENLLRTQLAPKLIDVSEIDFAM